MLGLPGVSPLNWVQMRAWVKTTLPAFGGVGVLLSAFLDSSFLPLPLVTDWIITGIYLDLFVSPKRRSSLLPQETGPCPGSHSSVDPKIPVHIRIASCGCAFSCPVQTVRYRPGSFPSPLYSFRDWHIGRERGTFFYGGTAWRALWSGCKRICTAPEMGFLGHSFGAHHAGIPASSNAVYPAKPRNPCKLKR